MSCWALIPLKTPALVKQRLAGCLSPHERRLLVARMAERVIDALRRASTIDAIAVTSPDPLVLPGVHWIADRAGDLNAALTVARQDLLARGARELLVLHADLPWLTPQEVDGLVLAGRDTGIAFAPDRHGRGTNAFYSHPAAQIDFAFGPDSLARHRAAALACGLEPTLYHAPGLAWDVDEAVDLQHLPAHWWGADRPTPDLSRTFP